MELQDARSLAQKLWDQCRQSASSYRLLSSSLRNFRNVLEELEELELRPDEMNIEPQIEQSYQLLERLNSAFSIYISSRGSEVDESLVADFKTSLDVLGQNLATTHDSLSTGEIPLKLDPSVIPALASPSSHWGSTSASAVDSGQERPSTRTSSAYSSIAQDNPWRHDDNGVNHVSSEKAEKEVYGDNDLTSLEPANSKSATTTATAPSLDWRAPFAFDPMSTSIEQASNMILRDDNALAPNATYEEADRSSHPSASRLDAHVPVQQPDTQTSAGLGVSQGDNDRNEPVRLQPRAAQTAIRPRAVSEIISRSSLNEVSASTVANLHAARSMESIERASPRRLSSGRKDATTHLSPTTIAKEFGRRDLAQFGALNSSSAPPIHVADAESDVHSEGFASSESYRKDLSIVFENAGGETEEPDRAMLDPTPDTLEDACQLSSSATEPAAPPPPPPSRRPPSPPKQRQVPKIPKRSPTYRVVNREQSDESSSDDEERPSALSKSSESIAAKPSSPVDEKEALRLDVDHLGDGESGTLVQISSNERRASKEKISHAQRVLMARAAYTPPAIPKAPPPTRPARSQTSVKSPTVAPKLSTQSLNVRRYSEDDSPSLKRYLTSTATSSNRPVTAGDGMMSPTKSSMSFEQLPSMSFTSPSSNIAPAPPPHETSLDQPESPLADGASILEKQTATESGIEFHDQFGAYLQRTYSAEAPDLIRDQDTSDNEPLDDADLDAEHVEHIVHFWNRCAWDQAESHLSGYLEYLLERNSLDRARRVRHLLGVCASFRGQWQKALSFFLAVLRTPISDISDFDDGDCAAAYWLGDTYALLNRRVEALLAYRIAEHSPLFANSTEANARDCINAEQDAVQLNAPLAEIKSQWAKQSSTMNESEPSSILDLRIVTASGANSLFDEPRKIRAKPTLSDSPFQLDPNKPRLHSFWAPSRFSQLSNNHRVKIAASQFEDASTWPMMYDPFLSMANIQHGRLLVHESDLLAVFNTNAAARIPKAGPTNIGRMESFASPDLNWLITTLRECLRMLDMDWSEVSNVKGTWFVVRHSFMQDHFATTHYFSISILRHAFRSAYGLEIGPDGICASRIIRYDLEHQKGVHVAEHKRVKKLIREFLDNAAKERLKAK